MNGGLAGLLPAGWAEPVTLLLMLGVFGGLAAGRKWPLGLALVVGAWGGAALNGDLLPLRHLVEGAFSYLDPLLAIATAMLFMRLLADAGHLPALLSAVEQRLGRRPALLLPAVMLLVMFPGMVTGSSTASILTAGAMAAPLLVELGLAPERAGALVAMGGVLGMVAPPINIPAMLIGGGIDLPYAGFGLPLALAAFPLALAVAYGLGWPLLRRSRPEAPEPLSRAQAAAAAAEAAGRLPLFRALLPVLLVVGLMVAPRLWPSRFPDLGLPLIFALGAVAAAVTARGLTGQETLNSLRRGTEEVLPVLSLLVGVGAFIQVMTVTGGRGLLVDLLLGVPPWARWLAMALGLPLFGAVSAFGSASVLGVPLLLAMLGRNEIITTAGLSLLAALGDLMLPASLAATLGAQVAGVSDRLRVLRLCLLPALAAIGVAMALIVWAPSLGKIL